VRKPHTQKRHEIQEGQPERRDHRSPTLERQYREEVLRQIVDDAPGAAPSESKSNRCQKHCAAQSRVLHHFASFMSSTTSMRSAL